MHTWGDWHKIIEKITKIVDFIILILIPISLFFDDNFPCEGKKLIIYWQRQTSRRLVDIGLFSTMTNITRIQLALPRFHSAANDLKNLSLFCHKLINKNIDFLVLIEIIL